MTEQEKNILTECIMDSVKFTTNTIYEGLAMLFEEMAKHPELSLQQVLLAMSTTLKKIAKESEKSEND